MVSKFLVVAGGCALLIVAAIAAEPEAATRGRDVFERRCAGCHSLDNAKAGPPLRKVFGRHAAADPKFPYSDALRGANLVWDEEKLGRWLEDPDRLVPDNDMSFRVTNAAERDAIVAYLKQTAGAGK